MTVTGPGVIALQARNVQAAAAFYQNQPEPGPAALAPRAAR
jgi:hypothetical protein